MWNVGGGGEGSCRGMLESRKARRCGFVGERREEEGGVEEISTLGRFLVVRPSVKVCWGREPGSTRMPIDDRPLCRIST